MPAFLLMEDSTPFYGYELLLGGCFAISSGLPTWYANVAYLFLLIFFAKNKLASSILAGIVMLLLMSSIILLFFFIIPGGEVVGFPYITIDKIYIGTYLWFISLLLPVVFAMIYKDFSIRHLLKKFIIENEKILKEIAS